jgi:predicted Rossmann fold nucleotide-binding protein DprA/Smf involved in DNA uptake
MVSTMISQGAVHPDTEAVLLLCGTFAKGSGPTKPLNLSEYNALAAWLSRLGKRPADLLRNFESLLSLGEPGLPPPGRVRELLDRGMQMALALEHWQRLGIWVISRGEDRYPERLRRNLRSAAPPLLYGAGDIARLGLGGLAIIGSRDIDEEGLSFTRRVAERCAGQDIQVISGGARGVDQAAVAAALEAGGGAIVVLADRLDRTATSRDAKEPLRSGLLTLITPYEPESGFTVGKAMGRNKNIYALADSALVVRFTTGEGGTWAGVVEQLCRNKSGSFCVPVFFRSSHNPEDGSAELRSRGALPFPEEDFSTSNILDLLNRTVLHPKQPQAVPACDSAGPMSATDGSTTSGVEQPTNSETVTPSSVIAPTPAPVREVPAAADSDTCYHRCLPLLLQHLQQEVGTAQLPKIAKQLELQLPKLKMWLSRAVGEGKVKKKSKKRVVYIDASLGKEQTMFDRDGDAA